jgi:hypothetical protein
MKIQKLSENSAKRWESMDEKIKSSRKFNSWKLVELGLLEGAKALACNWAFRVKMNRDESID